MKQNNLYNFKTEIKSTIKYKYIEIKYLATRKYSQQRRILQKAFHILNEDIHSCLNKTFFYV